MIRSSDSHFGGIMVRQSVQTPSRSALRLLVALTALLCGGAVAAAQSANTPLLLPSSVASDNGGNLYFAEAGNHVVRRLTPAGVLAIFAGTGTQGYGGDSGPATAALLDSPAGLALDATGDLFIADTHNHLIRRVDAVTGTISTYAKASLPVALAFNGHGLLVYADATTHQVVEIDAGSGRTSTVAGNGTQGFSGDGSQATAAMIDTPSGLAFDGAGNLFLADAHNHRVRRVDAVTGIITTVAGTGQPGFSGDRSAAGGAQLDLPRGLALDASGGLLIADSRNQRIRRVDASTGVITTIAGDGTQAFLGDGAPATAASLDTPRAVTLSAGGLPTLADSANNRVRQVDATLNIQTIAGSGAISPARTSTTTTLTQPSPATLAVAVNAGAGTATGTATLIDGTNPLATAPLANGAATFATSLLSTGSHTLTAMYSGNSALLPSTSQALIVTIGNLAPADFTLTASAPTSVSVVRGGAATFAFAVAPVGGALNSPIVLAVLGAPSGSTASFSPALIPPGTGVSTFTLTIDTPASAGLREVPAGVSVAFVALLLPIAFGRSRRRAWLLGVLLLAGCGARVNTGNSSVAAPVSYNVTVSATATSSSGAALVHTAQVTLIVAR